MPANNNAQKKRVLFRTSADIAFLCGVYIPSAHSIDHISLTDTLEITIFLWLAIELKRKIMSHLVVTNT